MGWFANGRHPQLLVRRRVFGNLLPMRCFFWICFFAFATPVLGAEIKIDFADGTNNLPPAGFHGDLAGGGQPGVWTIVPAEFPSLFPSLDGRAPAMIKRLVLAQTSQDPTDERFPLFIYDGENFQDFALSTRFETVSGAAEQMAGVVFRFQNASNFYVVRASTLGHNVRFYKMVDGVRSAPIGPELEVAPGAWHTLTVQCSGTQITFGLDNNPALTVNDPTFTRGKVGYWTKSDAVSYFSDLDINYTPVVSSAQALVNNILLKESRLLGLRIYALDRAGQAKVIGSKDPTEIGMAGGEAEKAAITKGTVSMGRGPGTLAVWLPFRDRNGDPIAAIWVRLKSFYGETQDTAVTRGTEVVRLMQAQINSLDDLLK